MGTKLILNAKLGKYVVIFLSSVFVLTIFPNIYKIPVKIGRRLFHKWEYVYYRLFYSKSGLKIDFSHKRYLLCDGENLDCSVKVFSELFPDKVKTKVAEADLICEHIFDLLGSGQKKLSPEGDGYQPIDWHSDFKSGYRWDPKIFYKSIRFGHIRGVDVKVPWELSRFQHLTILGQAYILTKNKKYAVEFVNQINDWIGSNKVGFGVNWKCPMDVAIRAVNWLVAMEFFEDSGLFTREFLEKFYISLYEHGKFIRSHLEYSPKLTTNHYLSDLAGIFFIAVYCPYFKESKEWKEFALEELSNEMEKQVYDDGCDFEASTSYHRLVLEILFYSELLGERAGIEFPDNYRKKLLKMFEFSLYCIKPNGMIPQIGDNDSGRFLTFTKRPVLDHKYLLTLASIYFKNPEFKLSNFHYDEEAFLVFGAKGKELYEKLSYRSESLKSKAFPNAGWYIMRNNNNYCFISCGPNGQNGNGGHAHNDKLSFELMLDGKDIIIDPGTFVYTPYPEWRNKFRSTAFHNTIQIDDTEQNDISKELFAMGQRVVCRILSFEEKNDEILFEGEVEYLSQKIIHTRKFVLDKQKHIFTVVDNVKNEGIHKFFINFCLGSGSTYYEFKSQNSTLDESKGFYSNEYGKKEEMFVLNNVSKEQSHFRNTLEIQKNKVSE